MACSFRTKYENEIIYHSKKRCKETSDVEDNEPAEKEEPVTPEMASDRRISTRLKKRKYVFDYDDIDDDDHGQKRKRSKRKDLYDDYKPSEGDTESSLDSGPDNDPAFRSRLSRSEYKTGPRY